MIGVGFPDEWLWVVGIVFPNEAVDGGLEIDDGMEDAVLEPAPGEFWRRSALNSQMDLETAIERGRKTGLSPNGRIAAAIGKPHDSASNNG
jgi:hypothetical protein